MDTKTCDKMVISPPQHTKAHGNGKGKIVSTHSKDKQLPNKANICVSSFVFTKDNVSSNWKNFKQSLSHLENDGTADENKRKEFRNKRTPKPNCGLGLPKVTRIQDDSNSGRKEITKVIAMDCEMVGIDTGKDSMLARVSLVNKYGNCIYDKFVRPMEPVVDYRTAVSGIRPKDLHNGEPFEKVQKEVAELLNGRTLVGHALRNDLKVLFLSHPRKAIRDTSRYKRFRKLTSGKTPSLRKLAEELLGVKIQQGEHSSVVDARAAMQLYLLYKKEWEKDIHTKHIKAKSK